jgi:hypothetical protein
MSPPKGPDPKIGIGMGLDKGNIQVEQEFTCSTTDPI